MNSEYIFLAVSIPVKFHKFNIPYAKGTICQKSIFQIHQGQITHEPRIFRRSDCSIGAFHAEN